MGSYRDPQENRLDALQTVLDRLFEASEAIVILQGHRIFSFEPVFVTLPDAGWAEGKQGV